MNNETNEKNIRAIVAQGEIYGKTHLSMLELALRVIKGSKKGNEKRWEGISKDKRSAHAKMMVTKRINK
jgi:hypothetical protein